MIVFALNYAILLSTSAKSMEDDAIIIEKVLQRKKLMSIIWTYGFNSVDILCFDRSKQISNEEWVLDLCRIRWILV